MIFIAYRQDITIGANHIKTTVVMAFMANEGILIIENLGIMGVPLQVALKRAIDVLTEKADSKDE